MKPKFAFPMNIDIVASSLTIDADRRSRYYRMGISRNCSRPMGRELQRSSVASGQRCGNEPKEELVYDDEPGALYYAYSTLHMMKNLIFPALGRSSILNYA